VPTNFPFTPTDIEVFSDGRAALVSGNDTGGAASSQLLHINIPARDKYTQWANTNDEGATRVPAVGLALGVFGAIFIPSTLALNVWPGGMLLCRHSYEEFEGELLQVTVLGAE